MAVSYDPSTRQRELVMMIDGRESSRFFLLVQDRMARMGMGDKVQISPELHVGDVMWVIKGTEKRKMGDALQPEMFGYVCEVKKAQDWRAGIIDGRHGEQKGRFFNVESDHTKMIFLTEGNLLARDYGGASNEAVMGSIANTVNRDNCRFANVPNTDGIADFLVQLHFKLEYYKESSSSRHLGYSHYIQASARKRDVRADHLLQSILINHVQGISADIADAVVRLYPSFPDLMAALLKDRVGTGIAIAALQVTSGEDKNNNANCGGKRLVGAANAAAIVTTLGISQIAASLAGEPSKPVDSKQEKVDLHKQLRTALTKKRTSATFKMPSPKTPRKRQWRAEEDKDDDDSDAILKDED